LRRGLRVAGVVAFNCAVLAAIFGVAEFTARTIQLRRIGPRAHHPEALRDRWTAIRNNPAYGRPGVTHNAQGFRRAAEIEVVKPANTVRIILLGGSVTYGGESLYPEIGHRELLRDDETIDYYLEQQLSREFPSKHWEVVNAGVKGYLLNQDLALLLSVVLRYHPDYVISLDGVNDLSSLLRAPRLYDAYLQPELVQDFNNLANPSSFGSLRAMAAAWLRNDSVLFYSMQAWMSEWSRARARALRSRRSAPPSPLCLSDLRPQEQEQYKTSAGQLDSVLTPVQLMHAVLEEQGIGHLFALQPEILFSRKPWAGTEQQLLEYHRKMETPVFVYGFETLYPRLAASLRADAVRRTFDFLDLTSVFDGVTAETYTDYCHLTPTGNKMIADRLFTHLSATFRRAATDAPRGSGS